MLPDHWDEATRHEDKLSRGIADVSFCQSGHHGWMELKHVDDFPVRDTTLVRIPHYHDYQRNFLRDKGRAGGNTWLFVQVGGSHFLFDHETAASVGFLTRPQMFDASTWAWERRLNYLELKLAMEQ